MTGVVTTVSPPTASMREFAGRLRENGASLIVVADQKGPADFPLDGARLLSLRDQQEMPLPP